MTKHLTIAVHTFATDDDYGTQCGVFPTQQDADLAALEWCVDRVDLEKFANDNGATEKDLEDFEEWWGLNHGRFHWTDLYEVKGDPMDTCVTDEHWLTLPVEMLSEHDISAIEFMAGNTGCKSTAETLENVARFLRQIEEIAK